MPVVPHVELGVYVRGAGEEDPSAQVKVRHLLPSVFQRLLCLLFCVLAMLHVSRVRCGSTEFVLRFPTISVCLSLVLRLGYAAWCGADLGSTGALGGRWSLCLQERWSTSRSGRCFGCAHQQSALLPERSLTTLSPWGSSFQKPQTLRKQLSENLVRSGATCDTCSGCQGSPESPQELVLFCWCFLLIPSRATGLDVFLDQHRWGGDLIPYRYDSIHPVNAFVRSGAAFECRSFSQV